MALPTRTRRRSPAGRQDGAGSRWWLWAGLASAAMAVLFAVLIATDLTASAPRRLALPKLAGPGVASPSNAAAAGPVSGSWTVGPGSQAGYRVHEVLFGLHHTAVGRTAKVSGGITISGSEVVAANFTVQMGSVLSDQTGRNVMWQRFIMDTRTYPQSHFRLTRPIQLGSVPPIGKVVTARAAGQLTMRGLTRTVVFSIRGERVSASEIDLNAAVPIVFAEWKIPNPSFAIAKVGTAGTLEVLLRLVPSKAS